MINCNYIKPLLVLGVSLLIASCSQNHGLPSGDSAPKGPQIESKAPGIMKKYDSFYISDIAVYSIEGDRLRRIDDREVQILAEDFRRTLIQSLGSHHSTIPQPSRNTAVIKVALTDVSTNYAALQIVPGMLVPNAMRGGASIDAIVSDSVNHEQLVRVRDSRSGERQGFMSGFGKWDGAKRAFEEWAQMLAYAVTK